MRRTARNRPQPKRKATKRVAHQDPSRNLPGIHQAGPSPQRTGRGAGARGRLPRPLSEGTQSAPEQPRPRRCLPSARPAVRLDTRHKRRWSRGWGGGPRELVRGRRGGLPQDGDTKREREFAAVARWTRVGPRKVCKFRTEVQKQPENRGREVRRGSGSAPAKSSRCTARGSAPGSGRRLSAKGKGGLPDGQGQGREGGRLPAW
nr:translation initiation factor IF-2-like [Oryctolagus cuniculus]